jgi:hypothetical protein
MISEKTHSGLWRPGERGRHFIEEISLTELMLAAVDANPDLFGYEGFSEQDLDIERQVLMMRALSARLVLIPLWRKYLSIVLS